MRYLIGLAAACTLGLSVAASAALAGPQEDCRQKQNRELQVRACSEIIDGDRTAAWAYNNRGSAYVALAELVIAFHDLNFANHVKEPVPKVSRGDAIALIDRAIADFNEVVRLKPGDAPAYANRGFAHGLKRDFDRAIADYSRAINLNPALATVYRYRGQAYRDKGDNDRAILDLGEAIKLNPNDHGAYSTRAEAYRAKGDYQRAIVDYSEAIRLDPSDFTLYTLRASVHRKDGDYDRAISDYSVAIKRGLPLYVLRGEAYGAKGDILKAIDDHDEAIRLNPGLALAYSYRANAYRQKGDHKRAIEDHNRAIVLDPSDAIAYASRGETYEATGNLKRAIEDYNKALNLPSRSDLEKDQQARVRTRLAALQSTTTVAKTSPPAVASPGRRVALVIGNAAYRTVKVLPNPINDGRELAGALRAAEFTEVVEHYDLGVRDMQRALSTFEDKATGADWAVVYYAGHGIEVDGRNYLIPIDAELKRTSDVEDETLPLDRVLARVAVAKKLQLVILDACRDNPFAPRMAQPGGVKRTVGSRGLARIEPEHPNLFIAYSARHGEAALDGVGKNSPYAKALMKHLAVPGLSLSTFFIRVRTEVLAETSGKQRPFEYGSLTDENLFFRPVAK